MARASDPLPLTSDLPGRPTLASGDLAVVVANRGTPASPAWHVSRVAVRHQGAWRELLSGAAEPVFVTTAGSADARACAVRARADGGWEIELVGGTETWDAREILTLEGGEPVIRRRQTVTFRRALRTAIRPGLRLGADPDVRYTCPLFAHEQPLAAVAALRPAVDWALPFPFHLWHDGQVVAILGVNRAASAGTVELVPESDGGVRIGTYFPDTATQPAGGVPAARPQEQEFAAGASVSLESVMAVHALKPGEEPWLEAQRLAAGLLLRGPRPGFDAERVAARIAGFYHHCGLWVPDALGPGRGWFSNMWVRTQTGPARKRGEMSGYFDLGWGEGIAVETWLGGVRHWRRTGDAGLLPYIDEMTRGLDCFRREPGPAAAYYDRTDGRKYGDFLMDFVPGNRVWTHSLGHTGSQLVQLYQLAPDYPKAATREAWREAALTMGRFLAQQQRPDGDLPDIFDEHNREANRKPHRITARAVVCGLWTRLGEVTGDALWTERARRLAAAVAPSIGRYEYHNQMLDGIAAADREFVDGEAACYVLEGLVPLYRATTDAAVLALCQKAAAFAFAWTYFYDLPKAHRGIARGGQCCRMDDYPLLYPIGPAKAMEPVLALAAATRDPFYDQMADEMAAFIGNWLIDAPGEPWDGGMLHAMGQFSGQHWGPDLAGQVDSGMATGNSLAALECWIERRAADRKS
ncbi:MAG: hypothetical protein JSR48_00665 [Verrucomicrobia bacterium]|nr:hypothetical protein [Verrucomicrobiota bacterium]